jgi:hypothetical protein
MERKTVAQVMALLKYKPQIKMMLFHPKVGLSIKVRNVAGGQRGGKGDNECYSETKKNQI